MTVRDALQLCKIFVLTLMAWCVPPQFWRKVAFATTRIGQKDKCSSVYNAILEQTHSKSEIAAIVARRHGYSRELKLQILGLNGPWRCWHPDVYLNGEAHLRSALDSGHGAILWVLETSFSTLMAKIALHNSGYRACQLSRPGHGFSSTPFGIRFLNPIWTRVEDRYIAERILIVGETAAEALKHLHRRLAANGIVIITVAPLAHKFSPVPFFKGKLELPTGPIRLALNSGAALLPIFVCTTHKGGFEVSIEKPLYPMSGVVNPENIAAAYAKLLESFVLDYPDQWTGWDWLGSRMRYDRPLSHSLSVSTNN